MITTLLVDMDGVFVDYEKHFNEHSDIELSVYNNNDVLEDELDELKKMFVIEKEFFLHAPMMEDALELYDRLIFLQKKHNLYLSLLTAVGKHHPEIAVEQKMAWAEKHLPNIDFNYVIRSHHKANFARPYTVLIDDREKSLSPFIKKGGKGILHTSAKNTIKELTELYLK